MLLRKEGICFLFLCESAMIFMCDVADCFDVFCELVLIPFVNALTWRPIQFVDALSRGSKVIDHSNGCLNLFAVFLFCAH